MSSFTIAVKRAEPKYRSQLKQEDKRSSDNFASLIDTLREDRYAGLFGLDRHRRLIILVPGSETKYAAECYFGDLEDVKTIVDSASGNESDNWLASPKYAPDGDEDEEQEPTFKFEDDDSINNNSPKGATNSPTFNFDGGDTDTNERSTELWQPEENEAPGGDSLWQPPEDPPTGNDGLWQPPTSNDNDEPMWTPPDTTADSAAALPFANNDLKRPRSDSQGTDKFHSNSAAAAADAFYSGLTRTLATRADSKLYHMRAFNGWVKATQIAELDPQTKNKNRAPLRILDLACGKGGDLGKWTFHKRGVANYVGVDVARGSLEDAAVRAIRIRNKLKKASFVCADLGCDVPGRRRNKLLTWKMKENSDDTEFKLTNGGGIKRSDKFDVISVQFAIHYMMSTRERARRFFKTAGDLLDIGGNLVATTIDARVVLDHIMNMGLDFTKLDELEDLTVKVGNGACRLKFMPECIQRLFSKEDDDHFGLEYSFTLQEGDDHSAGVGDAVNLPEWLTPIPVLTELANEAGLELECCENFHEFYYKRKSPTEHWGSHRALYNMHVLNQNGSVSDSEWEVSRMYMAIKFVKKREGTLVLEGDEDSDYNPADGDDDDEETDEEEFKLDPKKLPIAMMKAKKAAGDIWAKLSSDEKLKRSHAELAMM